jgi:hypothetical protein
MQGREILAGFEDKGLMITCDSGKQWINLKFIRKI